MPQKLRTYENDQLEIESVHWNNSLCLAKKAEAIEFYVQVSSGKVWGLVCNEKLHCTTLQDGVMILYGSRCCEWEFQNLILPANRTRNRWNQQSYWVSCHAAFLWRSLQLYTEGMLCTSTPITSKRDISDDVTRKIRLCCFAFERGSAPHSIEASCNIKADPLLNAASTALSTLTQNWFLNLSSRLFSCSVLACISLWHKFCIADLLGLPTNYKLLLLLAIGCSEFIWPAYRVSYDTTTSWPYCIAALNT